MKTTKAINKISESNNEIREKLNICQETKKFLCDEKKHQGLHIFKNHNSLQSNIKLSRTIFISFAKNLCKTFPIFYRCPVKIQQINVSQKICTLNVAFKFPIIMIEKLNFLK